MGKKKSQKTKELSVALAETSISQGEAQQTPRKRGRPRKIVDKPVNEEPQLRPPDHDAGDPAEEIQPEKKVKTSGTDQQKLKEEEEQQQEQQQVSASAAQEARKEQAESKQGADISRSRGRRKSKPRKSS